MLRPDEAIRINSTVFNAAGLPRKFFSPNLFSKCNKQVILNVLMFQVLLTKQNS